MWNLMWLVIDPILHTNDSKWLDSFCDSIQPSHDLTLTRLERLEMLLDSKEK